MGKDYVTIPMGYSWEGIITLGYSWDIELRCAFIERKMPQSRYTVTSLGKDLRD